MYKTSPPTPPPKGGESRSAHPIRRFGDRRTLGSCDPVSQNFFHRWRLHALPKMNRFRTQITQVPANRHNLRLFTKGSVCNRLFVLFVSFAFKQISCFDARRRQSYAPHPWVLRPPCRKISFIPSCLPHALTKMNRFRTQITQVPANQHNLRLFTTGSDCNRLFAVICVIRVFCVQTNLLL